MVLTKWKQYLKIIFCNQEMQSYSNRLSQLMKFTALRDSKGEKNLMIMSE
jgi:hypothetical protein